MSTQTLLTLFGRPVPADNYLVNQDCYVDPKIRPPQPCGLTLYVKGELADSDEISTQIKDTKAQSDDIRHFQTISKIILLDAKLTNRKGETIGEIDRSRSVQDSRNIAKIIFKFTKETRQDIPKGRYNIYLTVKVGDKKVVQVIRNAYIVK